MTTTGIFPTGNRMAMVQHAGNTSGTKAASGSSFADMVSANLKPDSKTADSGTNAPKAVRQKDAVNERSVSKNMQTQQPDKTGTFAEKKTGKEQTEFGTSDTEAATEELQQVSDEALCEIRETVRRILKLDDAELTKLMEQLGITLQQLAVPQQLAELAVAAEGSNDLSVLLTSESVADTLKQLTGEVALILEQDGMSRTAEELSADAYETGVIKEALVQELPTEEIPLNQTVAASDTQLQRNVLKENTESASAGLEKDGKTTESVGTAKTDTVTEKESFSFEAVRVTAKPQTGQTDSGQPDFSSSGAMTQAEQFLQLVSERGTQQTSETSFLTLSAAEQLREIADQLLERVRVVVNPTHTSMEMTLNPESLGRVNLNIVSRQGAMTAQFTAQTQVAREAIESQVVALRETLESQGLKVDALEVTVSDFSFNGNQTASGQGSASASDRQTSPRRRSLNLGEMESIQDVTEEESIALDMMSRNGNQVDYTA